MKKKAMWLIAAAVFAADRVTKILAAGIPAEGIPLIPGVVRLRYAENTGAAFSMLSGHPWLLGILSLIIIAGAFLFLQAIAETDGRLGLTARPPVSLMLRDPLLKDRDVLAESLKVMRKLNARMEKLNEEKAAAADGGVQ